MSSVIRIADRTRDHDLYRHLRDESVTSARIYRIEQRQSATENAAKGAQWPPQHRSHPLFDALYWLFIGLGLLLALAWRVIAI